FYDSAGQTAPAFRIYYEDAPLPPELNGVLASLQPPRKADLALLNCGNWEQVRGAERLVDHAHLDAQQVILGLWEVFFTPSLPQQREPEALRVAPADVYRDIVAGGMSGPDAKGRVHVLAPGVMRNFPRS